MTGNGPDSRPPDLEAAGCAQLDLLKAAISSYDDGIVVVDGLGREIMSNGAGRHVIEQAPWLGPSAQGTARLPDQDFTGEVRHAALESPLARALRGETVTEVVHLPRYAAGQGVDMSVVARPLVGGQGRITGAIATFRDVTAQRQSEEALHKRERELQTLLSNLPDLISRLDRNLRFIYISPNSERISRLPSNAFMGRTVRETGFFAEADVNASEKASRRALATGTVQTFEYSVQGPGGIRYYSIRIVPEFDAQGNVVSLLNINQDITARKQAEMDRERLLAVEKRAREEAQTALRLRDEFLDIAAHELKTPVTNLRGHAELAMKRIRSGRVPDPQQIYHVLETIDRQAERLAVLTNHLIDIARLEQGTLELERRPVDLVALVRRLIANLQPRAGQHTLSLQAPPALEAYVDPSRMEEILDNLVDNALKYSPPGSPVEVDVSAPDPATARIGVRDHGPGIPPEQRAQIFTRFFKAGSRRPVSGLGMGLHYGQQIVRLHGGEITAEFPPDGGARFVVTVPIGMTEKMS